MQFLSCEEFQRNEIEFLTLPQSFELSEAVRRAVHEVRHFTSLQFVSL